MFPNRSHASIFWAIFVVRSETDKLDFKGGQLFWPGAVAVIPTATKVVT